MDDIVLRGMAKWPNVPAVYGWLSLDRRGQWLIKGERISNPTVTAFIGRNYERDGRGCWFFQNGPQRVFVQLDYAPLVLRVTGAEGIALEFEAHTGKRAAAVEEAWLDEDGSLLLSTDLGPGLIDDRDLPRLETSFVAARGPPLAQDQGTQREGRFDPFRRRPRAIRVRARSQRAVNGESSPFTTHPVEPPFTIYHLRLTWLKCGR
jgi:Protein of unknown function (DUF2946)